MRNYIGELKQRGYSFSRLSKETGVSSKELSAYSKGIKPLKSASDAYEMIRNANRRLAYQEARQAGLAPERANIRRRVMFDPELEEIESTSKRIVKAKQETTRYQLRILGEFYNPKTKDTRIQDGYSRAYLEIDDAVMEAEAVNDARNKLGGTNWELKRIIEREMMQYILEAEANE